MKFFLSFLLAFMPMLSANAQSAVATPDYIQNQNVAKNYITGNSSQFEKPGVGGWAGYTLAQTATVTIASPGVFTVTSTTNFYVGMPFSLSTTGALPTGLAAGTLYYVSSVVSSTTFQASATQGGSSINTTGSQSGVHTFKPQVITGNPTGGSPTVTCTRTTSTPLSGAGSFLITKDAANRMGEGCSILISIDPQSRGKVIRGQIQYAIASGTFADNDLDVVVFDVTNSKPLAPAPLHFKNHSLPADTLPFEFQASIDSTSYRIGFHTASISASAYTVKIDDIRVSSSSDVGKSYGSPVTDAQSFTPTGSWTGGNVTYTGKYWRVGDHLQGEIHLALIGAPTGTTLTVNLPSGFTIDTTKLAGATAVGQQSLGRAAVVSAGTGYSGFPTYNNTTSLLIKYQGSFYASVTQAAPGTFANGDSVNIFFSVPVVGASSSQVMSSDADTRVITMKATGTSSAVTSGNPVILPTVAYDKTGGYNASTGRYTVSTPGVYTVSIVYNAAVNVSYNVYKNAGSYGTIDYGDASGHNKGSLNVECVAGDILDVRPNGSTTPAGSMDITRLSGPAQIAASESVSALYTGSPVTGTLTTAYNTTTFGTKVKDSHNAYSGGTYTVPVSGTYAIQATARHSGTYAVTNLASIAVFVNGAIKYANLINAGGAQGAMHPNVVVTSAPLLAGDLITIRSYNSGTTPTFESGAPEDNYFSIVKVGNY